VLILPPGAKSARKSYLLVGYSCLPATPLFLSHARDFRAYEIALLCGLCSAAA